MDGIAEVDPGAGADVNAPPVDLPAIRIPATRPDDVADDVGDSFRLGVLIVAAAIAVPFLLGAMALVMAWRRRRGPPRTGRQLERGDARDELVALGEEIQALDLDVEMPDASARGREEYERALRLYDRANQLLGGRPERGRALRGPPLHSRTPAPGAAALTRPASDLTDATWRSIVRLDEQAPASWRL